MLKRPFIIVCNSGLLDEEAIGGGKGIGERDWGKGLGKRLGERDWGKGLGERDYNNI